MNIKQIKHFFKNDYHRLVLMTGGKTTPLDLTNKSRLGYYQNVFNVVSITIAEMENTPRHPYKKIIVERFINHNRLQDLEPLIGYRHSATCKKINEALVCFATELQRQQIKYNFYPLIEFE
ncbi:hypothetical protein [Lactobacillus amylovorus]|uniref:hypothetical protein n=1 Tax=Lactobacillus amylovorus TaxID=1604 RepID=UPI003F93CB2B